MEKYKVSNLYQYVIYLIDGASGDRCHNCHRNRNHETNSFQNCKLCIFRFSGHLELLFIYKHFGLKQIKEKNSKINSSIVHITNIYLCSIVNSLNKTNIFKSCLLQQQKQIIFIYTQISVYFENTGCTKYECTGKMYTQ